jgi:hypothetical protein
MDRSDVDGTILPGDSLLEAVQALGRVVKRAGRIANVAKRRYERNKTKENEHWFMLASQEYYYVSKLCADFKAAAVAVAAAQHAKISSTN